MSLVRIPLTTSASYAQKYRNNETVYASLELNQVAFPQTGMVVSQVPLGTAFTVSAPCENGMWVVADKAAGAINAPAAATDKPIGIVYTTEKEYDDRHYGLQYFRQVAGEYPRVGILGLGDTVTTNCLQYDDTVFANFAAIKTYVEGGSTAHVIISSGSTFSKAIPQVVKALPNGYTGIYGKVVKVYTMPNGEAGIKYQIVNL